MLLINKEQIVALKWFDIATVIRTVKSDIINTDTELMYLQREQPFDDFLAEAVKFSLDLGLRSEKHLLILSSIFLAHLSRFEDWDTTDPFSTILVSEMEAGDKLREIIEYDARINAGWS